MSLRPDDRSSKRSRSKSRTRDRSRSRDGRVHSPPEFSEPVSVYPGSSASSQAGLVSMPAMPYLEEERIPSRGARPMARTTSSNGYAPYPTTGGLPFPDFGIDMGGYTDLPPHERPGFVQMHGSSGSHHDDGLAYGTVPEFERGAQYPDSIDSRHSYRTSSAQTNYQYPPSVPAATGEPPRYPNSSHPYEQVPQYKYAAAPDKITYSANPVNAPSLASAAIRYASTPHSQQASQVPYAPMKSSNAHIVEVRPGLSKIDSGLSAQMDRLAVNGNRLSVSGGRPDLGGSLPPPSPLLEAYRGTYQSISPMVAPMMLHDDELSDLAPLSPRLPVPGDKKHRRRKSSTASVTKAPKSSSTPQKPRRIKIYDAEADALALNEAISHSKINADAICDILPRLMHDQILELRTEYKRHIKVQGRGMLVLHNMYET